MNRDWQCQAVCRHPTWTPADFSPIDTRGRVDQRAARDVAEKACRHCPVRLDCLNFAAQTGAEEVVMGGMWFPPNPYPSNRAAPLDLLERITEDTAA